jgi:hypothetical protein
LLTLEDLSRFVVNKVDLICRFVLFSLFFVILFNVKEAVYVFLHFVSPRNLEIFQFSATLLLSTSPNSANITRRVLGQCAAKMFYFGIWKKLL